MDLNQFIAEWQNEADFERMKKIWNSRADEFNENGNNGGPDKRRDDVVRFLVSKAVFSATASVLDIGCGPGHFALKFAERAQSVLGLDIADNMLTHARNNARKMNCDNVKFAKAAWETTDLRSQGWEKQFDLVFASMCPGISNSDALLKMCRASRNGCFLSSFVSRSDRVRDALQRDLLGTPESARWGKNIYYAFNILYLSGYHPEVQYVEHIRESTMPVDQAVEFYALQLWNEKLTEAKLREEVRRYLEKLATDGLIQEKMYSKVAWLFWRVS
jgi:SAM-dependent methyltransferase